MRPTLDTSRWLGWWEAAARNSQPNPNHLFRDGAGYGVTHEGRWLWLADPTFVAALPVGRAW